MTKLQLYKQQILADREALRNWVLYTVTVTADWDSAVETANKEAHCERLLHSRFGAHWREVLEWLDE